MGYVADRPLPGAGKTSLLLSILAWSFNEAGDREGPPLASATPPASRQYWFRRGRLVYPDSGGRVKAAGAYGEGETGEASLVTGKS